MSKQLLTADWCQEWNIKTSLLKIGKIKYITLLSDANVPVRFRAQQRAKYSSPQLTPVNSIAANHKITISSLVIGLKKSYFPLIHLPSCYRTVCYWIVCYWTVCYRTVQQANHIQRCSLNQPITFKVVITCACVRARLLCVFAGYLKMFTPPLSVF